MEKKKVIEILKKNAGKNFIDRISNREKYGYITNEDGSYSTHSMAWGGVGGGKYVVFPTVVQLKDQASQLTGQYGEFKRLNDEEAFNYAIKNNEYLMFDSSSDADQFSREYKKVWGN